MLKTSLSAFSLIKICWFARIVWSLQPRMLHPQESRHFFSVAVYASFHIALNLQSGSVFGDHSWHPHTWLCSSSCLQSSQTDLPLRQFESRSLTWLFLSVRWFAFQKTLIWQYLCISVLSSSTDMLKQNIRWGWLTQERNKVWPGGVWQVRSAIENSSGCKP